MALIPEEHLLQLERCPALVLAAAQCHTVATTGHQLAELLLCLRERCDRPTGARVGRAGLFGLAPVRRVGGCSSARLWQRPHGCRRRDVWRRRGGGAGGAGAAARDARPIAISLESASTLLPVEVMYYQVCTWSHLWSPKQQPRSQQVKCLTILFSSVQTRAYHYW